MRAPDHLNALRAFEAAARHGSFLAAASELHVTPAAVGQLVRSLEDANGTPLFHRGTSGRNRLVLTDAARRALPDIREGFDRLSIGVARMQEASTGGVLTVTVSPAFAAKWLLQRIHRFQAARPDTDVRLDASIEKLDFASRGIDIGVRYGAGTWPGLTAEKLMDEEVYPVCSPVLLKQKRALRTPSELAGMRFIHDVSVDSALGFATWKAWLENANAADVETKRGLRINNSAAVLQAAIDHSQARFNGTVRIKLYKGMAQVVGRKSPDSLYSERHVTFEDVAGAYDQQDAAGFIKLNALRLRLLAQRDRR
jgi:LysR family glycine cleavage system transcriptional activator